MEDFKKSNDKDKDIVFSKAVRAGKRIYYIDVKKNRKGEMYLAVTESKRIMSGNMENQSVNFEKHKIFLYREDLENFTAGFNDAVDYIKQMQPGDSTQNQDESPEEISFDIDF